VLPRPDRGLNTHRHCAATSAELRTAGKHGGRGKYQAGFVLS
jgi:hypothetical protein